MLKHTPKKKWGQNFLVDESIKNRIFEFLEIEDQKVVEIGAGRGEMSEFISKKASEFVAYEIDPQLVAYLQKRFGSSQNTTIKHQDFLEAVFDKDQKTIVVGNIPYNITSQILFKLFENHKLLKSFYGVLQDEVAQRITASPKEKQYGKLSVAAQFFGKCNYIFKIDKSAFWPAPKVNSAFIKIEFFEDLGSIDSQDFLEFTKRSFANQRKKLSNNWKSFLNPQQIKKVLEEFDLSENTRAQEVSVSLYVNIYNYLKNNHFF